LSPKCFSITNCTGTKTGFYSCAGRIISDRYRGYPIDGRSDIIVSLIGADLRIEWVLWVSQKKTYHTQELFSELQRQLISLYI